MRHQIRSMLGEGGLKLSGTVEVDETYIGGINKGGKRGRGSENKKIVAGAVEREGSVVAKVVPDVRMRTLIPFVKESVSAEAVIYTDEMASYGALYVHCKEHKAVNHRNKQWVDGDAHTNSIEGFWSLLKGGIRGVYRSSRGTTCRTT